MTVSAPKGLYIKRDPRDIPRSVIYCSIPTDAMSNASYTFTYDTDDNVETITKTVGTDSWVRTLSYTGGNLTGITVWSVV